MIVFVVFLYFLSTLPFLVLFKLAPNFTRKILNFYISFYSRLILIILRVKITIEGNFVDKRKNYFIVSNHLSYLDIFIISSRFPTSFVTSIEMKKTPLLGQIATLGGCLFVERRSRNNIKKEISEIDAALKDGLNVVVFPEAKSTNGEKVWDFKRSLFQSAINAETSILPLTLNYDRVNDLEVNLSNRDSLFWYDDMEFLPHIINLCKLKNIEMTIQVSELIENIHEECDSKILRDHAHNLVSTKYRPILK